MSVEVRQVRDLQGQKVAVIGTWWNDSFLVCPAVPSQRLPTEYPTSQGVFNSTLTSSVSRKWLEEKSTELGEISEADKQALFYIFCDLMDKTCDLTEITEAEIKSKLLKEWPPDDVESELMKQTRAEYIEFMKVLEPIEVDEDDWDEND